MAFCSNCGAKQGDNEKFCGECGYGAEKQAAPEQATQPQQAVASAPRPKFCSNCGAQQSEAEKFCGECGYGAGQPSAPVQAAQPQQAVAPAPPLHTSGQTAPLIYAQL